MACSRWEHVGVVLGGDRGTGAARPLRHRPRTGLGHLCDHGDGCGGVLCVSGAGVGDPAVADLAAIKAAARTAAFVRRKAAFEIAPQAQTGYLAQVLAGYPGVPVSGYMAMRTEIDPLPAMVEAAAHGPVGVPVFITKGEALRFALWEPGCRMVDGPFKAQVPAVLDWMTPQILIVPLLTFDGRGGRLGYRGGFYDRTLAGLRARGPVLAIGFAFAGQEVEAVPTDSTDQHLDLIVTEMNVLTMD